MGDHGQDSPFHWLILQCEWVAQDRGPLSQSAVIKNKVSCRHKSKSDSGSHGVEREKARHPV